MICIHNLLALLSVSLIEIVKKLEWQYDWDVEVDQKLARDRFFFEDLCLQGLSLKETKEKIRIFMGTQTFEHDLTLLKTMEPLKFLPTAILREIWIESILYDFELDLAQALNCKYNSYRFVGLNLKNVNEMADNCITDELYAALKKKEGDFLFEELAQKWASEFADYFD